MLMQLRNRFVKMTLCLTYIKNLRYFQKQDFNVGVKLNCDINSQKKNLVT